MVVACVRSPFADPVAMLASPSVSSLASYGRTFVDSLLASGLASDDFPGGDCRSDLGNPTQVIGGVVAPSRRWEADNLVMVTLPWRAHAAWNPKLKITGLQVHRRVAASLRSALADIWTDAGKRQAEIDRLGMSSIGGGYNWRQVREGEGLSAHAYGCAVDFDPGRNSQGSTSANFARPENRYVVDDFGKAGWTWGGTWPRPDGMHFQATTVAIANDPAGVDRGA